MLKVDGTTDILSARAKSCVLGEAPRNAHPVRIPEQLKHRPSSTNDQRLRLDTELLSEGIDRIQGEVALSTLDTGKVPSRHTELLGETFLRQLAHKTQFAHLRSKHLFQQFCHASSLGPGSHDFQEVIGSGCSRGDVTHDTTQRLSTNARENVTVPKSRQAAMDDQNGGSAVQRTPRALALLAETWESIFEVKRQEWTDEGLYQPYEAFASGEPCRACRRPLLDELTADNGEVTSTGPNVDNAAFRGKHEGCRLGFWSIVGCGVDHCHQCCPPPPLSPSQVRTLRTLLRRTTVHRASWHLSLTCGHVMSVVTRNRTTAPTTARCPVCDSTRGVVEAAPGGSTGTDVADEVGITGVYRLFTDEQWRAISSIVHPDSHPRRGRPSADARSVVNAILYRDATSIPWRELPSTFGSWRTVARRHRQWMADGSWDEVLRLLSQSEGDG